MNAMRSYHTETSSTGRLYVKTCCSVDNKGPIATWWRFCWHCLLYFSWKVRFFDLIKHLSKLLDQKTCVWKTSTLNKKEIKKKGNRKEVKFMGIRISSNFFKSKKKMYSVESFGKYKFLWRLEILGNPNKGRWVFEG